MRVPAPSGRAGRRRVPREHLTPPGAVAIIHEVEREQAGVAQLVEYELPKLGVAGSNPVARSSAHAGLRAIPGGNLMGIFGKTDNRPGEVPRPATSVPTPAAAAPAPIAHAAA